MPTMAPERPVMYLVIPGEEGEGGGRVDHWTPWPATPLHGRTAVCQQGPCISAVQQDLKNATPPAGRIPLHVVVQVSINIYHFDILKSSENKILEKFATNTASSYY